MVISRAQNLRRRFVSDERGLSLTEGLLVMPIVMITLTAMIEFGAMVYEWNLMAKASQYGARMLAVSSPLVGDDEYIEALEDGYSDLIEGDPTPAAIVSIECGAGTTPCDADRLDLLMTGGDGVCGEIQADSRAGVCDIAPFLSEENVYVRYQRTGLGYVGRPWGPVSTITLEFRNQTFDFFILDSLIPALGNIEMPSHPVAITSEDLNSCRDGC